MTEPNSGRLSRRTLAKGAAWTVPAIAVAAATPAMAQSQLCVDIAAAGSGCKVPGSNDGFKYTYKLCFTNSCSYDVIIDVTRIYSNSGPGDGFPFCTVIYDKECSTLTNPAPVSVPAGTTLADEVCTELLVSFSNSSASKLNVFFKINGGSEQKLTIDAPVASNNDCPA